MALITSCKETEALTPSPALSSPCTWESKENPLCKANQPHEEETLKAPAVSSGLCSKGINSDSKMIKISILEMRQAPHSVLHVHHLQLP